MRPGGGRTPLSERLRWCNTSPCNEDTRPCCGITRPCDRDARPRDVITAARAAIGRPARRSDRPRHRPWRRPQRRRRRFAGGATRLLARHSAKQIFSAGIYAPLCLNGFRPRSLRLPPATTVGRTLQRRPSMRTLPLGMDGSAPEGAAGRADQRHPAAATLV